MSVSRSVIFSGVSSDGATAGGSGAVGAAVFGCLAAAAVPSGGVGGMTTVGSDPCESGVIDWSEAVDAG
eukprot:CAMPEP_0198108636 /NCGR_PEP_ID=MMETSP1442-20131203/684_1 /TAXON_ID= /ORGANISM="Craspedostauros australis, Strain CCMP3328" /LENGTH=68 /DNA_ID=CAMNT_0043763967 /DNA_START=39 /DNA_END=245 /DNA_ORIENTATION=+